MSFKPRNLTTLLLLLSTTLLLSIGCDKEPATAPTTPHPAETPEIKPQEVSAQPETETQPQTVRHSAAALRDQFQQEANTEINADNAESILNDIERELTQELAELDQEPTPTP